MEHFQEVRPARRESVSAKMAPRLRATATRLTIRVNQPETEHTVSVGKLQTWLDGGGKSPNEKLLKSRLREML